MIFGGLSANFAGPRSRKPLTPRLRRPDRRGVQPLRSAQNWRGRTCVRPLNSARARLPDVVVVPLLHGVAVVIAVLLRLVAPQIGRASCRGGVEAGRGAV